MPALVKNPPPGGGGCVGGGGGPLGPRPLQNKRLGGGAYAPRSLALCALRAPAAPRAGWVFTLPLGCSA